jgi:hypothetical protein
MEYYAKLVHINKGIFNVGASVWKTDNDSLVESVIFHRKFISYYHAKVWSEKKIMKLVFSRAENSFIREKDIIRRKWND